MTKTTLPEWLNKKIVDLMQERGERITLDEIASYIGIKAASLSHYLNNRQVPSQDNIVKIAAKFGDGIYDALGLPRPDPLLDIIVRRWGLLPEETRKEIAGIVEGYAKEGDGVAKPKAANRHVATVKR